MRRRIAFRLLAAGLSLAVGLLLAEAVLRLFRIAPERYPSPQWSAWDGTAFRKTDDLGRAHKGDAGLIKRPSRFADVGVAMGEYLPGARFKIAYGSNPRGYFDHENAVLMTVNSLGLRGEEIQAEKPAGTYRILGLGDSFTFGYGVKDEDTFLHRLQGRLNADAGGARRFEVLNAGVGGYNTRDAVICLERRWLALKPDLVLIVFYINDAYDDTAILNTGQGLGVRQQKRPGLAEYSYLWDLLQHRYWTYREAKEMEKYYQQPYFTDARRFVEDPGEYRADWMACRGALERAAEITRERKIKLALVMFPDLYKLKSGYPFLEIHALVQQTCAGLGIPFCDLLDAFQGHDPASLWVHPSDHHPNETAHAMAAEAVERFVRHEFLTGGT